MTSRPLEPGAFTAVFERLAVRGQATGAAALTSLALAVERQAKLDLALTRHSRGTPTPAHRGGPPALVSGTLRRAVAHTQARPYATGWEIRVGIAAGFYPPGGKTPSSEYGAYLERGELRNGAAYPWLVPAFHKVLAQAGTAQIGRYFAADWRRL